MRRARVTDSLAVVEAGYDLGASHNEWVARLTQAISSELTGPLGTVGYTFERQPVRYVLKDVSVAGGEPALATQTQEVVRRFPIEDRERFYRARGITSSVESCLTPMPTLRITSGAIEFCGVVVGDERKGIAIGAPMLRPAFISQSARRRWRRICAHLTAVWRLRTALGTEAAARTEEAVLTTAGRVVHASGGARDRRSRDALGDAVRAMERARGPLRRRDPQAALDLWRELVAGRWTLAERFDHDGQRFLVAHANPPEAVRLRELTPREHRIVLGLLRGESSVKLATSLHVSTGAVSQQLRSILRKLRLPSAGALVMLASRLTRPNSLTRFEADGLEACFVDAGKILAAAPDGLLSRAERQIAGWLLDGLSNAFMAELRGTTCRTIANQVARLYDKLGVSSRTELGMRFGVAPSS